MIKWVRDFLRGTGLCICGAAAVMALPVPSAVAEDAVSTYTGTYHKSFLPSATPTPYAMDNYNRKGASITLDYIVSDDLPPTITGSGTVRLNCTGKPSDGGWAVSVAPGSKCWNSFTLPCYYEAGVRKCGVTIPARSIDPGDVEITPRTLCDAAHRGAPVSKEYCVFGSGVTGSTGDDMFSVTPGASAYLEYLKRGPIDTPNRLTHIWRTSDSKPPLMLPSGPLSGFSDYDAFMANAPEGDGMKIVSTESCYAIDVKICEDVTIDTIPPFDGQCGAASGKVGDLFKRYFLALGILPEDDLCTYGSAKEIADRGSYFSWLCEGIGSGALDSECLAGKALRTECGAAHNQTFADKASIPASDLCFSGIPSAVTGDGPWNWKCRESLAGDAESASCSALPKGESCSSNVGDVVYILDDSDSMKSQGKLGRAQSVMDQSLARLIEKKSRQLADESKLCVTGMQARAFVNYVSVPGCRDLRAYARKSCGVPVSAGGNEAELSAENKNKLCANYWGGTFHSPADPAAKPQILTNAHNSVYSFADTDLSTPMYRRIMQAAQFVGSGDAGKPNKIIVVTDGNDLGWEKDKDALDVLKRYTNLKVYILHIVKREKDTESKPKKDVVSITNGTGGFYAKVYTEDSSGFEALMNLAVMGCEY